MNIHIKSVAVGAVLMCLLAAAAVVAAFLLIGPQTRTIFHDVALASGKVIKVTATHFAWGVEHGERHVSDDSFVLEYVSTVPHTEMDALDRETVGAFELIRPISELWGLRVANVAAFPSVERKGTYFTYAFTRNADGTWKFERQPAKVFIDD